jgi:hypothetical protein
VPLEFDLAIGMQRNQVLLKYVLDWAITRKKDEIAAILKDFGVPLVQCSRCAVEGDLPSHGSYFERRACGGCRRTASSSRRGR